MQLPPLLYGEYGVKGGKSTEERCECDALDALAGKLSFWVGGVLVGLALLIEDTRRRGELAMYVLPKALESAWVILRGRGAVPQTGRYGDALLTAVGMGMVMVRSSSWL